VFRTFFAVLWDFGGVLTSSPFAEFARYETAHGLPAGFLRTVNSTAPDTNAWARLERNEISAAEFDQAFATESAAHGHAVAGRDVIGLLGGALRPEMVAGLDAVNAAGFKTACLTNNVIDVASIGGPAPGVAEVMARFDVVVESSKVGVRKPEPAFYERACALLDVEPAACVFLDDLGINLKPARAMGMATIKVDDPHQALAELSTLLHLTL
jgi:putative hydrolase of the HAD superfamily